MNLSIGEKVIGAKRLNKNLTPNSTINKLYLLSKPYSKIIFFKSSIIPIYNNYFIIGIEFDGMLIGKKSLDYKELVLNNNNNIFEELEIQTALDKASDNQNTYWQYITYIRIKLKDSEHIIGLKQEPNKTNPTEDCSIEYTKIELIKNCLISGIGVFNGGIGCFQIVYQIRDFKMDLSNVFYNKNLLSLVDTSVDSKLAKDCLEIELQKNIFGKQLINNILDIENLLMDFDLIGIENYEVLELFMLLFNRQMKWSATKDIITLYYPKMLNLIEKTMLEKNHNIINAVFRIDRMINHFIYLEENYTNQPTVFHKYPDLVSKIKHIWQPLVRTMQKIQQLQILQVNLNCYHIANISKNVKNRLFAFICFICQVALMVLLGLSVMDKNFNMIFPLIEGKVVIPLIFIFTVMVVYKQISNTIDFYKIFPHYLRTFFGFCDILSNIISSLFILFFNFFVLSFNDRIIDIVLNSVASLFIINLDDNILFETPDSQLLMIKNKIIRLLNHHIDKIPNCLFNNYETTPYTPWKMSNNIIRLNYSEYRYNNNLMIEATNASNTYRISIHL